MQGTAMQGTEQCWSAALRHSVGAWHSSLFVIVLNVIVESIGVEKRPSEAFHGIAIDPSAPKRQH
jgi:hypothetical protein